MSPTLPLLALGAEELIGYLIVILFIVIPAIGQLIAKMREQKKPEAGAPGPIRRPARHPAGQPAEQAVDDEIGDFLRKATNRLGQKRQEAPRPVAAQVVGEQVFEAEVAAEEKPLGGQLRQHVGDYLDAGKFQQRAGELGYEVGQADENLDEHLHDVFDHKLGRLAGKPGESATPTGLAEAKPPQTKMSPTAAAGFAALLSDAGSIRRAIVISEILQRPEQRW